MRILIATHNAHKLKEFREILLPLGYQVVSPEEVGLSDCEETGQTFQENSFQKAIHGVKQTGLMTLADDSGLCIHALNNEPGLFSARYAKENGGYPDVFSVIWDRLKPYDDWSAHFNCCLCLVKSDGTPFYFEGQVFGKITDHPDDSLEKFGYDPIFIPDGYEKPFGALSSEIKNKISHRAKALEKFLLYLKT